MIILTLSRFDRIWHGGLARLNLTSVHEREDEESFGKCKKKMKKDEDFFKGKVPQPNPSNPSGQNR